MSARPLLTLTGLRAGWDRPVVGPVSLELHRGEVIGLWGPNGSGKSTLLAAIANGARVFAGTVRRAPQLRLAVQTQQPVRIAPLPLTGRDLLRTAGADVRGVPGSLAAVLRRRVDRLSGGQYQLLCVWAALTSGAELVLLDEPTNNLDPDHESLLAEMLSGQIADRAVLLVSHEQAFLKRVCSRVIEVG